MENTYHYMENSIRQASFIKPLLAEQQMHSTKWKIKQLKALIIDFFARAGQNKPTVNPEPDPVEAGQGWSGPVGNRNVQES